MIEIIGTELNQWDTGRSVKVTGTEVSHVHFANQGDSKAVIMELANSQALVPDYLLQTGKQLCVYAVANGVTIERKMFSVKKRERPENYVYDEDQRNFIYALITDAQEAAESANQAAQNASESSTLALNSAGRASVAAEEAEKASVSANKAATLAAQTAKSLMVVGKERGASIYLDDAIEQPLVSCKIFGKTTQDGTPTPDAPVELVSAGDGGSVGVMVGGKNIFQFGGQAQVENGSVIESTSIGGTFQGNPGDTPGSSLWSSGWVQFERVSALHLTAGTIITISADYTVLEKHPSSYGKASIILDSLASETSLDIKKAETGVKYRISKAFVISKDGQYKRTTFTVHSSKVKIENVQWEVGEVASDFVPYKDPQTLTISTPNGLPGIPVTSGGNYTDANGQQWVCDEIDLARGVYVRRINTLAPQSAIKSYDNYAGTNRVVIVCDDAAYTEGKAIGVVMCDSLPAVSANDQYSINESCIAVANNNVAITIKDILTEDAVTQWLITNPIKIQYALATPIETPLSEEELAAYAALHTYKDHTTVFNDAGAHMELEYVMDAKKYIDSMIAGTLHPATVE